MRRKFVILLAVAGALVATPTGVALADPGQPSTQMIVSRHPTFSHCDVTGAAGKVQGWWRGYVCLWDPKPDHQRPWALDVNGI